MEVHIQPFRLNYKGFHLSVKTIQKSLMSGINAQDLELAQYGQCFELGMSRGLPKALPNYVSAMLCFALQCYAVPCNAGPCHAMPRHGMAWHAMACHCMPCHAMQCHGDGIITVTQYLSARGLPIKGGEGVRC